MNFLVILASLLLTIACTPKEKKLPSFQKYQKNTQLMLNICDKLAMESNPKVLNKVANNTLKARVLKCTDYFGECSQYGKFLSLAVKLTNDNEISSEDKGALRDELLLLRNAVLKGRKELSRL